MLLLKRCLIIRATAREITIKIIALKPDGVAAAVSIKIPTINPEIAAVSSEQNIQIITKSVKGNNGLACEILIEKVALY